MADIFEYSEVRWPSRTEDQEEEEQALEHAKSILQPPLLSWTEGAKLQDQLQVLVLATSSAANALLQQACPDRKPIGTVSYPDNDSSSDPLSHPSFSPPDHSSCIYSHNPSNTVLSVECSSHLPAERAGAWVRAVLPELKPAHVLILGSLQAEMYRGEGDASQESLMYLLETESGRRLRGTTPPPVPYLPTGTVVPGLAAAALSWCQLRSIPAHLLVSVDMVAGLVPHSIPPLAAASAELLKQAGAQELSVKLSSKEAISAAQHAAAGSADVSAMYT